MNRKYSMRFYVLILMSVLMCCGTARAAEQSVKLAALDVTVWSQDAGPAVKQPVILFSHGFKGCATQSRFLMEAFASAGYLVFAPNHRDAVCHGGKSHWYSGAQAPLRKPALWNDTSYRDRADDICRLIDAIRADERFRARVDWSRLGLAGHSLGGYTVLGLCGAWPGWKIPGVKAVLALSPYSQPFILHKTLADLSVPVMYQGGTWDYGATPRMNKTMLSYEQSPAPKYYVEFKKAGHFAWTNMGRTSFRGEIIAYSLAFMNHYVKGEPAEQLLTHATASVAKLSCAAEKKTGNQDKAGNR
jgi:pimeloyl-ACP methyl ester carboxylesterase